MRTNLFHINISINLLKNIKWEVKIHALLIFVLANVIFMKKARVQKYLRKITIPRLLSRFKVNLKSKTYSLPTVEF